MTNAIKGRLALGGVGGGGGSADWIVYDPTWMAGTEVVMPTYGHVDAEYLATPNPDGSTTVDVNIYGYISSDIGSFPAGAWIFYLPPGLGGVAVGPLNMNPYGDATHATGIVVGGYGDLQDNMLVLSYDGSGISKVNPVTWTQYGLWFAHVRYHHIP